jgi:hypothetical protein
MSSVKRENWDGTRILQITHIGTDNKISVGIRQISVIRILFQLFMDWIDWIIRIFHPSPISGITLITPCSTTAAPTYHT